MALKSRIRRRTKRRSAPKLRRSTGGRAQAQRSDAKAQMQAESPLMIGGAHDPSEKAADRLAASALAGPTVASAGAAANGAVHRKCAACANSEEAQNKVSRKCAACAAETQDKNNVSREATAAGTVAPGAKSAPASPGASEAIGSMGSGRPMAPSERAFFEPRFQRDFSNVRLHEGAAANRAADMIDARAFAHGNDIAFAQGERERGGKSLMAHELAHVATEGGAARRQVRRLGDTSKIPSGMSCPVPANSPSLHDVSRIQFTLGGAVLTDVAKAELSTVASGFFAMGGGLQLRVDGFASTDGSDETNWTLSCQRAEAVRAELASPSDGSAGVPSTNLSVFAQGETSEFSRARSGNRVATVRSDAPFAPVSCDHGDHETRASACIQPIVIADDDGSNPTSPPSFRTVQDIWARCCVDISISSAITVNGTRFKDIHNAPNLVPTAEETAMIDAVGSSSNCVPVFIVDTINLLGVSGKNVSGGGYTLTSGLPGPHIVVVEGGSSWLVAHELGHAFDVHHPLGTRADGQATIAQPTGSFNGAGSEKVSDPICTATRASAPVSGGSGGKTCCKDLS